MKKSRLLLILGLGLIACTPNTSYNKPSESQDVIETPSSESLNSTNKDSVSPSSNTETSALNTSTNSLTTSEDSSQESLSSSSSTTTSEGGLDINSQTTIDSGVWEPPVIVC